MYICITLKVIRKDTMSRKLLFFVTIFCLSTVCQAQPGKLFTVDHDLPCSMINRVYQDHKGNIWIATENGLSRYDGAKFSTYKLSNGQNNILSLYESNNNLFVGFNGGLQSYDFATDSFTKIPLRNNGHAFTGGINCIGSYNDHQLLIGTCGNGLFLLNLNKKPLTAYQLNWPMYYINCMMRDLSKNIWISTNDKGLIKISGHYRKSYFFNGRAAIHSVSSIIQDHSGRIYIGTLDAGMFIYNTTKDNFTQISGTENFSIRDLCVVSNDKILIATDSRGVKSYLPYQNQVVDENYNVFQFDFTKSKIHSIIKDNAGNLWLGVYQKGLLFMPNFISPFQYIGYRSPNNNFIGSCCITALCKDNDGSLWVGTDNDGIYGVDKQGHFKVHFPSGKGNMPNTVMSIFEDSNHNMWIGSYMEGLFKFNKTTGTCTKVALPSAINETDKNIYGITEDSQKNLYVGTMGEGLFIINLKTNQIINQFLDNTRNTSDKQNSLSNRWINSLMISHDNKIYIGTFEGLGCYDVNKKSFISTFKKNHIINSIIYTTYEDIKHNIWAGAADGMYCIEYKSHKITHYTINNGLPNNIVYGIKGNNNGLWISTAYGISNYNFKNRKFTNYYSDDGLQGNEFSRNAAITDKSGDIYLGGINGITYFNPDKIQIPIKKLELRLTAFYIHDKAVSKGMKSGFFNIINTDASDADKFHLCYDDNSFSLEFSTTEFSNPERITYMYSIDKDKWITLQPGNNRISFSNLAPGTYHFAVRAKEYEIYSNIKTFTVIIAHPWYSNIWANIIYLILIILAIRFTIKELKRRYAVRQQLTKERQEQQISEAKLQFFINISHDIRTPMTLVISPLQKLLDTDKDKERSKSYRIIYRNAQRILNLINQLMDVRKIDKGQMNLIFSETDIVAFINDILSVFEFQAKQRNIDISLNTNSDKLIVWIDSKNFDKIMMNLLSNAFKFTPDGGHINVTIQKDETDYQIIVSDDGIPIEEDKLEQIFNRFYQVKNSPNHAQMGTGIGLDLTRSLVYLHHGSIKAENNEDGKGCRFIVTMPLGNAHLKPEEMETEKTDIIEHANSVQTIISVDDDEKSIGHSKTKYRIFVVEDDEEIRKYLEDELSSNYHVSTYNNGKDALNAILSKAPDLVISDVMMPEMDGITLCRKIKRNININYIPVILLTAKTREEDNIDGLSVGADSYITKPFNIEFVEKTIANLIKGREALKTAFSGMQQQEDKTSKIKIKTPDEKLLDKVMSIINKNISDPDFDVEILADQVGISRVHLHRKLKELTNQTTRDFIRNIRLQKASQILETPGQDISEVARTVGFSSITYFSTAFKALYGVPPTEYSAKKK